MNISAKIKLSFLITGILCAIIISFSNCHISKDSSLPNADILKIEKITDNAYLHISYLQTKNFGNVACNGLVYMDEKEAVVFDTPVNAGASDALLDWLEKEKIKTKAVVVNHFHVDCLGGLNKFHKRNISTYASNKTIELAKGEEVIFPKNGFDENMELKIGGEKIHLKYFGEAHTVDNIIGWMPNEKMLFGGCMVKSVGSGKGNLADANVDTWSETVSKIKNEYPDLKYAIPGHGKTGGVELLDYTINMFQPISQQKFIFFFHNRFLENNDLDAEHREYGRAEYAEIMAAFKKEGFNILSEKRKGNVDAREYALKIRGQMDSLILKGVKNENITVIGTSKGGYIAQYVSTFMADPKINYVFIGSYQDSDMEQIPEINFCGNILNIYEKTDPYGVSAKKRKEASSCTINRFKEVELNTGLKHGFLFKAMDEWIKPCVDWANGIY